MSGRLSRFYLVFVLLIIYIASCPLLSQGAAKIGEPPPPVILPDISGSSQDLLSLLGDNISIVVFWTSWSKTCNDEMLFLEELQKHTKNVNVIGISFDRKASEVIRFVEQNGITFPTLLDKRHKYIDDFQLMIIPSTFIFENKILKKILIDYNDDVKKDLEEIS